MNKGKKQKEDTETMTVDEIKQVIESGRRTKRYMESIYPDGKPKKQTIDKTKNPTLTEFTYKVKVCGGSCHVQIPRHWLDKMVKVRVEEVKE